MNIKTAVLPLLLIALSAGCNCQPDRGIPSTIKTIAAKTQGCNVAASDGSVCFLVWETVNNRQDMRDRCKAAEALKIGDPLMCAWKTQN